MSRSINSQDDQRVPTRNFRAYRRVMNGATWLVVESYYYEIDDSLDRIWLAVDGTKTVTEVAEAAMESKSSEDLAAARMGIEQLVECEALEWQAE